MTGIHQRTAPTKINRTDWNDLVTFLGGTSDDSQIDATKILLAQGGSLLSTWRYATDLTKMDAAKVAGNIAAAQMQTNVLAAIIAAGGIVDADVAAAAAIAYSKLALSNSIVNADVNTLAAIALSKLAVPDTCKAYMSANTAIPTATWTTIALDAEVYDNNTMHDLVTNNSRITCKTAGLYLISGCVSWYDSTGAGNLRGISFTLNDASISEVQYAKAVYAGGPNTIPYSLAVNDYIKMQAYQDSGGNLNARGGSYYTWLSLTYLGRA